MKKFFVRVLCILTALGLCMTSSMAAEFPRYSIETVYVDVNEPVNVPGYTFVADLGKVTFPSYQTYCDIRFKVDLDTRDGSIVRVSIDNYNVDLAYRIPNNVPDNGEMRVEGFELNNVKFNISSDKKRFTMTSDVVTNVHYGIIYSDGQPPVGEFTLESFDSKMSVTYNTGI